MKSRYEWHEVTRDRDTFTEVMDIGHSCLVRTYGWDASAYESRAWSEMAHPHYQVVEAEIEVEE